jgi:alkanesulfonate monooxygenase SsuD/methylene tetrahydromethanopterin reductase-like flavin-dependent oxidoreductase (luciferase family)
VPIAFGGYAEAVIRRVVKYGVGYTLGGGTPEALAKMVTRVTEAWKEAGREGKPRFWALTYFAIGEDVAREAEENLTGYYGDYGPRILGNAVKTAADAKARVKAFEAVGCDEFIFFMSAPAVEQAERLAEAVL